METNQNQPTRSPLPKNLKAESPSKEEKVLNYIKTVSDSSPLKTAWSHPVAKVVAIGGVALLAIWGSGHLLRLLTWWRMGYNQFKDAGANPGGLPPKD